MSSSSSARLARTLLTTSLRKTAIASSSSRPISALSFNNITRTSVPAFQRSFQTTTARMGVHNIANKVEFDSALANNKIVVLDAFATWCGPCKVIAPQVVKFSEAFLDVHFVKLDVDEVPDVAQDLGIRAMPTFIIFKNGDKLSEVVGANPQALRAAIEKAASSV